MSFQAMTWATEQELPAMQKIVLLMLANRTNHDTGLCFPSHDTLARECGMDKRSVIRQIDKLTELGLVEVKNTFKQDGAKGSNHYKLILCNKNSSDRESHTLVTESHIPSDRESHTLVTESHINQELLTSKLTIKDIVHLPTSDAKKPEPENLDILFERFWASYPKKQGKSKSLESFKKLKPDEVLTDHIVERVNFRKLNDPSWIKDGGQFVPMPTTYLNQKRWEDEITIGGATDVKKSTIANRSQNTNMFDGYFNDRFKKEFAGCDSSGFIQEVQHYLPREMGGEVC